MSRAAPAVVVTSIHPPNQVLTALAAGCAAQGWSFLVAGDEASPADFALEGCRFLSLATQRASGLRFGAAAPTRHYARKNVGYLEAIRGGASAIVETDDDNLPRASFFRLPPLEATLPVVEHAGWVNVYGYFTDQPIWPRGLPLEAVRDLPPPLDAAPVRAVPCPIHQGLADEQPDVDAVYRLVLGAPCTFRPDVSLALAPGAWCPFNSQNTVWFPEAYPLLYLPSHCSFRMTDIWRSLVAQRIGWANGWSVAFHSPTVVQRRNPHDLSRDFADEVPGYLRNARLAELLAGLPLEAGAERLPANLRACYRALVDAEAVAAAELELLEAWLEDLAGA